MLKVLWNLGEIVALRIRHIPVVILVKRNLCLAEIVLDVIEYSIDH